MDTFVAVSIVPLHCPIVPCAVTLWYSVSGYSSPNCSQSVALYFTCIIHFVEKARGKTGRSRNLIIEGFSLRFLWGKPWKLGWKVTLVLEKNPAFQFVKLLCLVHTICYNRYSYCFSDDIRHRYHEVIIEEF